MDIYHNLITKFGFDYMEELEIRFREDRNPNIFLPLHSVMFAESAYSTFYLKIKEFDEMIFMMEYHPDDDRHVHPLAKNIEDFVRLLLASHRIAILSEVPYQAREQITKRLSRVLTEESEERTAAFRMLAETFHLTPMEDPYGYVRALNDTFDFSKIRYSDDYYEQFDVPNPWLSEEERAQKPFQETVFFSSASHVLTINNKKD